MLRRSLRLVLMVSMLALALTFARAPQAHARVRDPILFVHGWNGSAAAWDTMVRRFRYDGWTDQELYTMTYDSNQSNAAIAREIKRRVNAILVATGAGKVDIITHSMGGVSSRYYLKNLGGTALVDAWVSLAGPNHGTKGAYNCDMLSCVEIRPGSQFLAALNAGDETPGAVRYATWWSPCDTRIQPQRSTILSGATNTRLDCVSHGAFKTDAAVYAQVRDWVDR